MIHHIPMYKLNPYPSGPGKADAYGVSILDSTLDEDAFIYKSDKFACPCSSWNFQRFSYIFLCKCKTLNFYCGPVSWPLGTWHEQA